MPSIEQLRSLLSRCKIVAVVGISEQWHRPSYFVGKYLLEHGFQVVPVNPRYAEVLGQRCYPDLL
ncbi:MAG: CoA-binding protein, partial [Betaproteobacteria bacterium]|nr:CoA-binding protein [Betaproteobacteria bacterium]